MENVHYVVRVDWCFDYEGENEIIGVYHTKEAANKAFADRVNGERKFAEKESYVIYEDDEWCFEAGKDGEYLGDHVSVYIDWVVTDDEDIKEE